jgi:predicted phosphodiesterase
MKLALFSDIHGNLSALEAVLEALESQGPFDALVCAGDLVYLGPSPADVVARVQAANVQAVRGNCEDYLTGLRSLGDSPAPLEHMQRHQAHIAWNRDHLSEQQLGYLRTLPLTLTFEPAPGHTLLVCHATPSSTEPDFALMQRLNEDELMREYATSGARIVAFGHWHGPLTAELGGMTLLNVSSVSLPFDQQPLAAYTVAEWQGGCWSFRQYRVGYDLTPELTHIKERAMPRPPWPSL